MIYKLLTNLLFEPRGKHNLSLTYNIKDTVTSEDGSKVYFALRDVPAGIPLTDTNYWMLQMDLSASKNAMDTAAANARTQTDDTIASANARVEDMMGKAADAVTSVADYAAKVGMRVKGETKITKGNPMTIYPDGGSLLKVQTDIPIKQLGEGDPYPGGGGRNKLPNTATSRTANGVTFTVNADGSVTANGTATDVIFFDVGTMMFENGVSYTLSGCPAGGNNGGYFLMYVNIGSEFYYDFGSSVSFEGMDKEARVFIQIKSGATVNATFYPMIRLASDTDTSYAPPSNIRPFVGYDELGLSVAGKNLLNNIRYYDNTHTDIRAQYDSPLLLKAGVTYTLSTNIKADGLYFVDASGEGNTDAKYLLKYEYQVTSLEYTPITDIRCLFIAIFNNGVPNGTTIQLEVSSATTHVPYQGSIHTVQLGKTTYQGHYDWLTGKFRAEWGVYTLTGEGSAKLTSASVHNAKCFMSDVIPGVVGNSAILNGAKSSHFVEGVWNDIVNMASPLGKFAINTSNKIGIAYDGTIDEANAWLAAEKSKGTPVQIAYKLATPIEMQLAPNVITAVEDGGMNYIYGDADLTVEWVKPLETSLTEHSNAKVDANNEALLMDVAQKERSVGNPVVINDAVANVAFPHVETVFSPKQAGSGDPYPAGGGKNLFDVATHPVSDQVEFVGDRTVSKNGEIISVTSSGIQYPNAALLAVEPLTLPAGTYTMVLTNTLPFTVRANSYLIVDPGRTFATMTFSEPITIDHIAMDCTTGQTFDVSFGICIRADNVAEYVTYANIRPITGYDALGLNHAGKNLIPDDVTLRSCTKTDNGYICNINNHYYSEIAFIPTFKLNAGMKITYSIKDGIANRFVSITFVFDDNTTQDFGSPLCARQVTATVPSNGKTVSRILLRFNRANTVFTDTTTVVSEHQLEFGSDVTSYAPYQGSIHTVQIGETVYGGRYNWLTGKLVAEWARVEVNTINALDSWGLLGATNAIIPDSVLITSGYQVPELLCDRLKKESLEETRKYNGNFITQYMSQLYIRVSSCDTLEKYQAWIKNNHFYAFYKLSTPIEIQLDPTRITTTPGTNTIFGDGEFTIDWFKSYKKIAEERENLLLDSFTDKAELSGNPITMTPVGGISFDSVVTEFSPKQAGSGDPYPAGGGKNLFNPQQDGLVIRGTTIDGDVLTTEFVSGALYIQTTDVYPAGTYTISVIPISDDISCSLWLYDANDNSETFGTAFSKSKNSYTFTKDASFYFGIGGISAALGTFRYKIQIELGSTATPYAPYENIRPITGYDKMDLNHAGKNLLNNTATTKTVDGVTFTVNTDGSVTLNGTAGTNAFIKIYGYTDEIVGLDLIMTGGIKSKVNMNITDNVHPESAHNDIGNGVRFNGCNNHVVYIDAISGVTYDNLTVYPMIRLASDSDSTYAPYKGSLHTVQIGQTVYGGRMDWLMGKLVADIILFELNISDMDNNENYPGWHNVPRLVDVVGNGLDTNMGESGGFVASNITADAVAFGVNTSNDQGVKTLFLREQYFGMKQSEWKAKHPDLKVQIACRLKKPTEIQLTPSEIRALSGTNTLYGDGNTITAKFRQSKDVDILKRLSALETLMTNQTKGE